MAKTHNPDLGQFFTFPRSTAFAGTGVYLLHRGGEVVYVGQAQDMRQRIGSHFGEGRKEFDGVSCIPCAAERLDRVESLLIERLTPEYNQCCVARSAKAKGDWRQDDTQPEMHLGLTQAAGFLGCEPAALREMGEEGPRFTIKRMPRTRSRRRSYALSDLLEYKRKRHSALP